MIVRFLAFILGMAILLVRFGLPILVLFLLFTFILQNGRIDTWSTEARAIFLVLSMLTTYGVYSEED